MKKLFYWPVILIAFTVCSVSLVKAQGGVAINAGGSLPDSSAVLDVSSFSKGLLMPRMSITQRNAIAKPATGLFVFNTDCNVVNFNAGTPENPNWVIMNSSNALVAGVSIAANPAGAICSGTSVTFSATPSQNNLSPSYQWQLNAGNVGTNSATYTNANLNNGDVVNCILTSNVNCVTGSPATSNSITVLTSAAPTITGTTAATFCSGSSVSLGASASSGTINWYNVSTGGSSLSTGASFTISGLNATTTYYVDATANGCTSATRTAVTATYYPNSPGQPGAITGPSSVSRDSVATYSISALPNTASYNWTVSMGVITAGQGTTSITIKWADSSTTGSVSVAAVNPCGTSATQSMPVYIGTQTFSYTGTVPTFTVPQNVTSLTILVLGAQGGNGATYTGGLGASMQGTFTVTPGQIISIMVGGQGGSSCLGGGGGGTFVASNGALLIAAGGGGGGGISQNPAPAYVMNATTGQNGNAGWYAQANSETAGAGGTGGGGGGTYCCNPTGGGGGGYSGNGTSGAAGGGNSYLNGGAGGNPTSSGGAGGYGGGGGGECNWDGGGGGGGYSGGGGGYFWGGGGGGGSYNNGTNQNNNAGVQSGNGQVVFTW